jgi:hypothetical protein
MTSVVIKGHPVHPMLVGMQGVGVHSQARLVSDSPRFATTESTKRRAD